MKNFWRLLPTPFFTLAPMADVTDAAFRKMIAKYSAHERADGTKGGPDVMWTEFVAADGLVLATKAGQEKLLADLIYHKEERPIVAQLFSSHEDNMEKASSLCLQLGFDGIDINMGCPVKKVIKAGAGAILMKNPDPIARIVEAVKKAVKIPVTLKIRSGWTHSSINAVQIAKIAEACGADAITVHARTADQGYSGQADWKIIAEVKKH